MIAEHPTIKSLKKKTKKKRKVTYESNSDSDSVNESNFLQKLTYQSDDSDEKRPEKAEDN